MSTAILTEPGRGGHRPGWRYARAVSPRPTSTTIDARSGAFADGEAGLRAAYDAHGGLVYGICRKALDEHAAKDVTQEVFLSAWRGRHQFDPAKGNLAAWLVGIAKRRIIDHLRSERRHADRRADAPTDALDRSLDHSVEPDVHRTADRMLVADALNQLAPRTREVIELAYVHDLTHHDIAARTGIPLGTVKSDIRRGLLRIRDHLDSTHG
jgi:RNA polymerase sigma-70 factor (ECF subfamily)